MIVGVENYWRFNGIKTSSIKARTKVLASFEAGMNLPNLAKARDFPESPFVFQ